MKRREFLRATGACTTVLAVPRAATAGSSGRQPTQGDERPNILFIMSDDHAANAVGCYMSRINRTPNIDRLAREGMRFENCFCANSICTPSRASILTGKHSHRNGVRTLDDVLNSRQRTFPKLLQQAGYYTGVVGKWHLTSEPAGFDYYNVLPGQGDYFNPRLKEKGKEWQDGEEGGEVYEGYVTDVITDIALRFLKSRPKDKPFCLLYHHKAPHDMWEYDEKHAHLYEGVPIREPRTLFDNYRTRGQAIKRATQKIGMKETLFLHETQGDQFADVEKLIGDMEPRRQKRVAYQYFIKAYLRCVASIDDNIGRVLDYLDESGLTDNTIVVYTSDQGYFLGEHGLFDKRFMYEESLRVPLIVRYPKEIEPRSVNEDLVQNIDFAPTFLDYAGVPIPRDMHGRSLKPLFNGTTPKDWRRSIYYRYWMHRAHFNVAAHYGIRTKRYKLIFYYGLPLDAAGALDEPTEPEWELFDLADDPQETNNVYEDPRYKGAAVMLKAALDRLKVKLGDFDQRYPELMKVREEYWEPKPIDPFARARSGKRGKGRER